MSSFVLVGFIDYLCIFRPGPDYNLVSVKYIIFTALTIFPQIVKTNAMFLGFWLFRIWGSIYFILEMGHAF